MSKKHTEALTAFPLLSDEQIIKIRKESRLTVYNPWADTLAFARAIESESRAPLLAEIERLSEQVERLKADAEQAKRDSFLQGYEAAQADAQVCMVPPIGWKCTRKAGHEGPCAAVRDEDARELVCNAMKRLADAARAQGDTQ